MFFSTETECTSSSTKALHTKKLKVTERITTKRIGKTEGANILIKRNNGLRPWHDLLNKRERKSGFDSIIRYYLDFYTSHIPEIMFLNFSKY